MLDRTEEFREFVIKRGVNLSKRNKDHSSPLLALDIPVIEDDDDGEEKWELIERQPVEIEAVQDAFSEMVVEQDAGIETIQATKTAEDVKELEFIGRQLVEIQTLQDAFSGMVVEQDAGIGTIQTRTVNTQEELVAANSYLQEALNTQHGRRRISVIVLLLLAFILLFLHTCWYP